MHKRFTVTVAIALLVVLAVDAGVLAASSAYRGGEVTKVIARMKTLDTRPSTADLQVPTRLPGAKIDVNVPAGERALLLITFSGTSQCSDPDQVQTAFCIIAVGRQGTDVTGGQIIFDSAAVTGRVAARQTGSMTVAAGPLDPGDHRLYVRYWVDEPGSKFHLFAWSFSVERVRVS